MGVSPIPATRSRRKFPGVSGLLSDHIAGTGETPVLRVKVVTEQRAAAYDTGGAAVSIAFRLSRKSDCQRAGQAQKCWRIQVRRALRWVTAGSRSDQKERLDFCNGRHCGNRPLVADRGTADDGAHGALLIAAILAMIRLTRILLQRAVCSAAIATCGAPAGCRGPGGREAIELSYATHQHCYGKQQRNKVAATQ